MAAHEDLGRSDPAKGSSNRAFGWTFTGVFLVLGVWPFIVHAGDLRLWGLAVSGIFLVVTLVAPAALTFPNQVWQRFGRLLHRIVSPIALGILFYSVVTPIGALMRVFSKEMSRWMWRRNDATTYWIAREPPGPKPDSLRNQF